MTRIIDTKLVTSVGRLDKLPEPSLPEVAFAGRSNVGKSSLLNALAGRKNLFKVSKTPGRTRTIVHVKARLDLGAEIFVVDLPGYGFARVSKGAKEAWGKLIEDYLGQRSTLHLVVLLVDVRRGPEEEEASLLDYLADLGVPALLVATKIDRVAKNRRRGALDKLRREVGVKVLGTSAVSREGIDALLGKIAAACGYA